MAEDSYSIKEVLDNAVKDMKSVTTELFSEIKEIKEVVIETSNRVGIQNGRVRKLEDYNNDTKKIIEQNTEDINLFKQDKAKIKGSYKTLTIVALIVPITCTTIFGLYVKNLNNDIDDRIEKATEEQRLKDTEDIKRVVEQTVEEVLTEKIKNAKYEN